LEHCGGHGIGDGQPPLDVGALGRVCDCRWVEVLATDLPDPKAPAGCPIPNGTVQAATGADLEQGSAGGVMDSDQECNCREQTPWQLMCRTLLHDVASSGKWRRSSNRFDMAS